VSREDIVDIGCWFNRVSQILQIADESGVEVIFGLLLIEDIGMEVLLCESFYEKGDKFIQVQCFFVRRVISL